MLMGLPISNKATYLKVETGYLQFSFFLCIHGVRVQEDIVKSESANLLCTKATGDY